MKVATIVGTRPEIIRLSRIIVNLDKVVDHIFIHTGQNYDYELNEIFFNDLELRKPDYFLNVDKTTLGSTIGGTITECEKVLLNEKPDAALILGDTNSSLSAIIAKRLKIPVFHMEAGNRSFDMNVPEEINRRIVDHVADYNLVYSEHARRHLISEGIPHRRIYLTGSPMGEVLSHFKKKIEESDILSKLNLKPKEFFLVSSHREENVDNPKNLKKVLEILKALVEKYDKNLIFSTHPRTKIRLESLGVSMTTFDEKIKFCKPFGYFDYLYLQLNAKCTLSDSGTISEESAIMNFPAISLRESMERPEAQDTGAIILSGLEKENVLNAVDFVIHETSSPEIPAEYQILNTSQRVIKLILGNSFLSNKWWGINPSE